MPMTLEQIEHEVELLPSDDQQKLYCHLQGKFSPENDLDRIWGEESTRRLQSYLAGKSKAYSAEEAINKVKAELAAHRR